MDNSTRQTMPEKIDLFEMMGSFFRTLRGLLLPVLLLPVAAAVLMGVRSYRSYTPVYQAQAVLVTSYASSPSNGLDIPDIGSYYTSSVSNRQVISTFPSILSTDAMQQQLLQRLGVSSLNGSVSVSSIANSNLFTMKAVSTDPQSAYDILNAVIEIYPSMAGRVVGNISIEVVDEPVLPTEPINRPSWRSAAVKGYLLALIVLLAGVLALSQLRQTVHSPDQIKRFSGMTCMGHVPLVPAKKRASGKAAAQPLLLPGRTVPAQYQESIRTVRTRLLHQAHKGQMQVLMVTSTAPGEGKSTVAANLALSLAQAGQRVILIDGDLRAQTLRDLLGLKGQAPGLAELLRSGSPRPAAALRAVPGTTLQVICGSRPAADIARVLHTQRIQRLLNSLRPMADFVLVDTPPSGLLSDASAFVPAVDGVLYVVREDAVSRRQLTDSLQLLADAGANVCGYVFNGASESAGQYGYGRYSYGYGYGRYGYGYGRGGYGSYAYAQYGQQDDALPAGTEAENG